MINSILNRTACILTAGALAFGVAATPVLAAPGGPGGPSGHDKCAPGQPCQQHTDGSHHLRKLSAAQLHHLPPAPKGQHYRRDGDRIVRVNDNGEIIAAVGLFAALMAITQSH